MSVRRFNNRKSSQGKEKRAQERKTPMDAALKFLTPKARTVREVERYLDEQNYGEVEVQQVVDRLIELKYLDDAAYAEEFAASRLRTKPISRRKLYEQLLAHEIPNDCIEQALLSIDEEAERENAVNTAKKHAAQLQGLEKYTFYSRLYKRILSRGYSHEDVKYAIRVVTGEDGEYDTR